MTAEPINLTAAAPDLSPPAVGNRDGSGIPPRIWRVASALAPWTVAGVYFATYAVLPHDGMWINDNGCKFIQMESIIRCGYADYAVDWPGRGQDPDLAFAPFQPPFGHAVGGRLFIQYSPMFAVLASVPYRVLGMHGLLLLPMLGGLLTCHAASRLTARMLEDEAVRPLAAAVCWIVTGLASPLWFYSLTFWEHTPALALTCGSVCFLVDAIRSGRQAPAAASAALAAAAVYFRDELYVLAAVLLVVLLVHRTRGRFRAALVFAGTLLAVLIPLWLFQHWALGHALGWHFETDRPLDRGAWAYLAERWTALHRLVLAADPRLGVSLILAVPTVLLWIRALRGGAAPREDRLSGYAMLACVQGALLLLLNLGEDWPMQRLLHANGLFSVCPVVAFAMAGRRCGAASGSETTVSTLVLRIAAGYALAVVLLSPPPNTLGLHWGCRFLLSLYPLFAACASAAIARGLRGARSARGAGRVAVAGAVLVSMALEGYGVSLLLQRTRFSARLNRAVAERPAAAVVCRTWFLPQELFTLFGQQPVFLAESDEQERELVNRLARERPRPDGNGNDARGILRLVALDARLVREDKAVQEDGGLADSGETGGGHPSPAPMDGRSAVFRICDGRLRFLCVDGAWIDLPAPGR